MQTQKRYQYIFAISIASSYANKLATKLVLLLMRELACKEGYVFLAKEGSD
jgi:hypothetical protein